MEWFDNEKKEELKGIVRKHNKFIDEIFKDQLLIASDRLTKENLKIDYDIDSLSDTDITLIGNIIQDITEIGEILANNIDQNRKNNISETAKNGKRMQLVPINWSNKTIQEKSDYKDKTPFILNIYKAKDLLDAVIVVEKEKVSINEQIEVVKEYKQPGKVPPLNLKKLDENPKSMDFTKPQAKPTPTSDNNKNKEEQQTGTTPNSGIIKQGRKQSH